METYRERQRAENVPALVSRDQLRALLLVWAAVFIHAHDWMYRLHGRWFRLSVETFDAIHYAGMAIYKIGIFLLNLIPLLALYFM